MVGDRRNLLGQSRDDLQVQVSVVFSSERTQLVLLYWLAGELFVLDLAEAQSTPGDIELLVLALVHCAHLLEEVASPVVPSRHNVHQSVFVLAAAMYF